METTELSVLWQQRLLDQKESGLTVAEWCRQHSVNRSQYFYWRRRLQDMRPDTTHESDNIEWLAVETASAGPSKRNDKTESELFTLDLDAVEPSIFVHIGQARIEVKHGFDSRLFRQIVKALKIS